MYSPVTSPIPALPVPESKISYPVISFFRCIMQFYARAIRFREPVMLHPERMIDAWHAFNDGKARMILGFRHAYGDDPQLMAYAIHHTLPRYARKCGRPFRAMTHAHFVYGVEVPYWSGPFVGWLLPRGGAVPVNHVHMDSKGMNRIRKTVAEGRYPLALAPEGHVTYVSEKVAELETGTARFGFWCMEDLERERERAGRTERVIILPVSQHYRYAPGAIKPLSRLIAGMERDCGLLPAQGQRAMVEIAARLRALGQAILAECAAFYSEILGKETGAKQTDLLEASLDTAERFFNLPRGVGEPIARLYKIRTAGWDRIFRSDLDGMTPLRRELAARETGEAWYAMRHMESSEMLLHIDFCAVPDNAGLEAYIEIANNFFDCIGRLKGGTLKNRANIFDKYAVLVPGEPIVIDDYRELYRSDKKAALQKATDDLAARFQTCIEEYQHEYR